MNYILPLSLLRTGKIARKLWRTKRRWVYVKLLRINMCVCRNCSYRYFQENSSSFHIIFQWWYLCRADWKKWRHFICWFDLLVYKLIKFWENETLPLICNAWSVFSALLHLLFVIATFRSKWSQPYLSTFSDIPWWNAKNIYFNADGTLVCTAYVYDYSVWWDHTSFFLFSHASPFSLLSNSIWSQETRVSIFHTQHH